MGFMSEIDILVCGGDRTPNDFEKRGYDPETAKAISKIVEVVETDSDGYYTDYMTDTKRVPEAFRRARPLSHEERKFPFRGTPVGHETDPDILEERRLDLGYSSQGPEEFRRACPDCGLAVNEHGRTAEEEALHFLHTCRGAEG